MRLSLALSRSRPASGHRSQVSSIAAERGAAYIAAVHLDKGFPYVLPVDTMGAPYKSRLALFENGKLLGPIAFSACPDQGTWDGAVFPLGRCSYFFVFGWE